MTQSTAAEKAYHILKDKILFLELEPGSVLNEAEWMEQLNIGRSPIRDALRRLQQDDLVIILPRQGTLVSSISLADFHEIFELRLELEGLAAFQAAKRAKHSHLKAFEDFLQKAEQRVLNGDNKLYLEIDGRFHRLIAEAAGNRFLSKTLNQLFNHSVRLFNLSHTRSATVHDAMPDYRAVYQCVKERDAEGARKRMRKHILDAQERINASFVLSAVA